VTASSAFAKGLVVESVAKNSGLAGVDLRPGDVILQAGSRRLRTPLDLAAVETEDAPRGPVPMQVRRDGHPLSITGPPGEWLLDVRPVMPEPIDALYQQGAGAIAAGDYDSAAGRWREAATRLRDAGVRPLEHWLLVHLGHTFGQVRRWDAAHAALREARARAQETGDAEAVLAALGEEAHIHRQQNQLDEAEVCYDDAVAAAERYAPHGLTLAAALHERAELARMRGQLDASEVLQDRALALRTRLAPESLPHAASLTARARLFNQRGKPAEAQALLRQARAIQERLAPRSLPLAETLNASALGAQYRGDLAAAQADLEASRAISDALGTDSAVRADTLDTLGVIARQRGDLVAAESFHRDAFDMLERIAPGSLAQARVVHALGTLAWSRSDLERAEDYYRRALDIWERFAPDGLAVASGLANLGLVARSRGELARAEELYARALAIKERLAPGSWTVATTLTNLGRIARERNDLKAARDFQIRALAINETLAPGSLAIAGITNALGEIAMDRGDDGEAEQHLARALSLYETLAPRTLAEGWTLYQLGRLQRRRGHLEEALALLERSLACLEAHIGRLGGTSEERSGFAANSQDPYRAHLEVLVALGRPEKAFESLERSRARSYLEMLGAHDFSNAVDAPPEIREQRRRIGREYDTALSELGRLRVPQDEVRINALLATLRKLRLDWHAVADPARGAPPLVTWRSPPPLDLAGARAALDPGTVLLSYAIGPSETFLFVVSQKDLSVHRVSITDAGLREEVDRFRRLVRRSTAPAESELRAQAERLYTLLIAPAETEIRRAARIQICPDGPLNTLPWGALASPRRRGRAGEWLIEGKPMHLVASATVFAELRKARSEATGGRWSRTLVAFGDPDYAPGSMAALPATRQEVEGIVSIFDDERGTAQAFVGAAATEEKVRTAGAEARYLHLACHAFADEKSPLDSALVLSVPAASGDRQNGWLQAWEVMNDLRLKAELVTLSACDSGLGTEQLGQGLAGLARAFHFAGARSVIASLWNVADDSTAVLMRRFYEHLRKGRGKAEALRLAQIDLLRGKNEDWRRPFHWAAFQLTGDSL
jgi:CHAT domain-containing protein/Tfp pilus assembly protein PilF